MTLYLLEVADRHPVLGQGRQSIMPVSVALLVVVGILESRQNAKLGHAVRR